MIFNLSKGQFDLHNSAMSYLTWSVVEVWRKCVYLCFYEKHLWHSKSSFPWIKIHLYFLYMFCLLTTEGFFCYFSWKSNLKSQFKNQINICLFEIQWNLTLSKSGVAQNTCLWDKDELDGNILLISYVVSKSTLEQYTLYL